MVFLVKFLSLEFVLYSESKELTCSYNFNLFKLFHGYERLRYPNKNFGFVGAMSEAH